MLFFLRKLVEALLLPIGISGLLVVAGLAFRRRWLAISGVVILYAFSTPIAGNLMMRPLQGAYAPKAVADAPDADAIVVLSGGIVRGITPPGVQWGESVNRYFAGFDLAMAGKAKVIVFTAGAAEDSRGPSQGAILRQAAIRNGVQPERIILTGSVLTTEDEARAVSQIPGIHSVLLVTSAYHMRRAVLLFRARGLDVSPFPTDERALGRLVSPSEFVPVAAGAHTAEEAMREYYGLAVYRIFFLFRPLGRLR